MEVHSNMGCLSMKLTSKQALLIQYSEEGDGNNNFIINSNISENPNEYNSVYGKGILMNGGRGHWRPAEDSKLRELVAIYGRQNWNLIAHKVEGRSGLKMKDDIVSEKGCLDMPNSTTTDNLHPYYNFSHFTGSMESTSQVSVNETSHFETTVSPPFIDFLGVGVNENMYK